MRLAIVGSRTFLNPLWEIEATEYITRCIKWFGPELIISGGAEGIDTLAVDIANAYDIPTQEFLPDIFNWSGFKKRNKKIAEACTHLLCIRCENATTNGSGWTAEYAETIGKEVHRIFL
jgi:predicted Rossmann fold nucleotide-binding protein DprA/Smf involved in DNA uptake